MFCSGPFSAVSVYGAVAIAPIISVSGFFVCVMLGQMVCALLVDAIGALGFDRRPLSGLRIFGVLLVLSESIMSA